MQREQKSYIKKISVPFTMIITWIIIGTFIFHYIESWTYSESFYYSIATLTTVGYGDFTVTTDANRVIAAIYMLIGVTIAIGSFGYIGSSYLEMKEGLRDKRKQRKISKKSK